MVNMFYEMIGRLFSRSQMRRLGALLESSGVGIVPESFAGFMVVLCAASFALLCALSVSLDPVRGFVFGLASFISFDLTVSHLAFFVAVAAASSLLLAAGGICLFAYMALLLMADSRRRRVEDVLPDFLSLSASNVRAGMTIDQAMWYAAKPEFGILSDEVSTVAKKAFGGVPFNQSIDYLGERFNSRPLRRAVALIKQGLASGGQLADILERTAEDSRQMQILRKEISTSLLMYIIFIVFAGAMGTPFLFAVSGRLVAMLGGVFATLPAQPSASFTSAMQGPYMMPSRPTVTSSEFFLFTILSSVVTAVFSALIIGVISKGSKKDGVPYIPILVIVSLAILFVVNQLLEGVLSNIYI